MKKSLLITCLITLFFCAVTSAEEAPDIIRHKMGLFAQSSMSLFTIYQNLDTTSYKVGGIVHLNPKYALRPGITFGLFNKTEEDVFNSGDLYVSAEQLSIGASLDVFYFHALKPGLSFYFGPGLSYTYANEDDYNTTVKTETLSDEFLTISIIAGLQYFLNSTAAITLESGAGYRRTKNVSIDYDSITGNQTSENVAVTNLFGLIAPRIGVTIYFN